VTLQTSGVVDSIPPDYEVAEALVDDIAGKTLLGRGGQHDGRHRDPMTPMP
jgi:hypothetical protein